MAKVLVPEREVIEEDGRRFGLLRLDEAILLAATAPERLVMKNGHFCIEEVPDCAAEGAKEKK